MALSMNPGGAGTVCSVSIGSGWQQWSLGNTARKRGAIVGAARQESRDVQQQHRHFLTQWRGTQCSLLWAPVRPGTGPWSRCRDCLQSLTCVRRVLTGKDDVFSTVNGTWAPYGNAGSLMFLLAYCGVPRAVYVIFIYTVCSSS